MNWQCLPLNLKILITNIWSALFISFKGVKKKKSFDIHVNGKENMVWVYLMFKVRVLAVE